MRALLVVDLQNDFMPGGAFPIEKGLETLPAVNLLMKCPFDLLIASKDWHPSDHGSFAINQGKNVGDVIDLNGLEQILWPAHCIQKTEGSDFCPGWDYKKIDKVIYKGTDKSIDSYSAFFDNGHLKSTGLAEFLKSNHIKELFIAGVATDYCVKYTVMDALNLGFTTYIVTDGCRGINLQPHHSEEALQETQNAGAILVTSKEVKKMFSD